MTLFAVRTADMDLEFHQIERRYEGLRRTSAERERRLCGSLAELGQQTPVVVVAAGGEADRYVLVDGYKRVRALQRLRQDTVRVGVLGALRAGGAAA